MGRPDPTGAPRAGTPSQPPPFGQPASGPISTQPMPSPPPPAAPRPPPGLSSTQIGPGFAPIAPPSGPTAAAAGLPTAAAYPPPPATATASAYPPPPAAPGTWPPPSTLGAPPAAPAPAGYPPPPAAPGTWPPPPGASAFQPPQGQAPGVGDPAFMSGFGGAPTDDSVSVPSLRGGAMGDLIGVSIKRAFRLRIDPSEVLPTERAALELAEPPILDKNLQAFLVWRRSILFVVIAILAPLSITRLVDSLRGPPLPAMLRAVGVLPALAEAFFCVWLVLQVRRWTQWRVQRKAVLLGWLVFLLTPFVVYLYPLRSAIEGLFTGEGIDPAAAAPLGMVVSLAVALQALLSLAPKAISLMPGLIRAALVSKMLFPGTSGPGWLIVLAAPIYAMFAFTILIVPYQVTGSGWFVVGMIGLIGAQFVLARAGFQLARPCTEPAAIHQVKQVRSVYLGAIGASALFLIIALGSLVKTFDIGYVQVVTTILSFEANVLILTMIGTDLVITNLERARALAAGTAREVEDTHLKLAAFVGTSEPPAPPPFR